MTAPAGLIAWKIPFQLSPIIFVNGISDFMGGYLPLMAITEAINYPLGLLSGGNDISLDRFFANYEPMPGATISSQQIGHYPFANQAVAANATIQQPLTVSMKMTCVSQNRFGYAARLAIMTAVAEAITYHNTIGGTFIVATPSRIYTNCLFKDMREIGGGQTKQPQSAWQIDFEAPLLTLSQATQALSSMPKRIESGVIQAGQPAYSGLPTSVNPSSLAPLALPVSSTSITVQPLPPLPPT